jgi:hypothetical protein
MGTHRTSTNPEPRSLFTLPAELRNCIYTYVYGDFAVIAEASDNTARPEILIQLLEDDVKTGAETNELVKLGNSHRITGLQHTCRQIRWETEDLDPLWKSLHGTSGALFRVFDQPNPFENLRIVTISLQIGDTFYEQGRFNLSEGFQCMLLGLACLRRLKEVRVYGCTSFFDLEENNAFAAILETFKNATWLPQGFKVTCHSARQLTSYQLLFH